MKKFFSLGNIANAQLFAACVCLMLLLTCSATTKNALGDEGPKVHANVKNAWDNTHVWVYLSGINDPFKAVVECRDASGRLLESQTGITTQVTLDDDWRTINVIAVYGEKRYDLISIKARFVGHVPIYETVKGDAK